eukprot:COSAG03_NODE_307_length_9149_cov_3.027293_3_plen_445_part_00
MSAARVARVGWLVLLQAHVALAGGAADVTHKSQASLIVPRSQPVITALFEPSTTGEALGYPCFRQPELTPLGSTGELIAWTEAYPGATGGANGSCAPAAREEKATTAAAAERGESSDVCDLVYRRSTDFGRSWLPLQVLTGNNSRTTPSIDWYTTVYDSVAQHLFVFVRTSLASGLGTTHFRSTDHGATFSAGSSFTLQGGSKGFKLVTPSMSHGLQLPQGRLVAPFVCGTPEPSASTGSHTHSCTVFSDNHGESWQLGGLAQNGSAETAFVHLPGGSGMTLYASMRDRGPSARESTRLSARSLDGGESWIDFARAEQLKAPCTPHWCSGVVAGLAALNGSDGKPPLLVFSSPSAPAARAILRLFTSTDQGRGWKSGPILFEHLAGYSDMVVLPNNGLGVLFENGEESFSDRISFAAVPRGWIQAGEAAQASDVDTQNHTTSQN